MKWARQINFDTQGDVYVRVPSDLKKTIINRWKPPNKTKSNFVKWNLTKNTLHESSLKYPKTVLSFLAILESSNQNVKRITSTEFSPTKSIYSNC